MGQKQCADARVKRWQTKERPNRLEREDGREETGKKGGGKWATMGGRCMPHAAAGVKHSSSIGTAEERLASTAHSQHAEDNQKTHHKDSASTAKKGQKG